MDISLTLTSSTEEARLLEILSYYRPIEILHSTVKELCTSSVFKGHFQKVLQHDLDVIKLRSQNLEDHEISLMQKAFVRLMDEGDHIAGIELYVDEIIGLKVMEDKDKLHILRSSVKTKDVTMKKYKPSQEAKIPPFQGSSSSRRARDQRHVSEELFISEGSVQETSQDQQHTNMELGVTKDQLVVGRRGDPAIKSPDKDTMFDRLLNLYKTAKDDYCKTDRNTMSRTKAARFLRDTTENCILYIEDRQSSANSQMHDEPILRELRATLEEAMEEVEKGSGGKKRRFDDDWNHVPTAPKCMRGDSPQERLEDPSPSQNDREPLRKILPPPRGSYSYGRPRTAPISRYQQRSSQYDCQRSTSPSQYAREHPIRTLSPPRGSYSYDEPRKTPTRRYQEQHPSQFNHRQSASPGRYPHTPRQISMSERSRDRRRQDLLPGYYDSYRPYY